MTDKRHKNKEEFRREILDAARELFSSDGYGNFSMRGLARKIGYSPTTIYLYFRDKDDLLFCICEEIFGELFVRLQELCQGHGSLRDMLRRVLLAYVEFGLTHPEHYKLAFFTSPNVYGSPQEYMETDTMSRRAYFYFRDLVVQCISGGFLRSQDTDVQAQLLWAAMHGIVTAEIFTKDFPFEEPTVLAEAMVDALLDGLMRQS